MLLAATARRHGDAPANRPFLALIAACALQSLLMGLRWGYGIEPVRYVVPIVAAAIPVLLCASFGTLAAPRRARWLHLGPVLVVAALVAFWRAAIDIALIAIYAGYAAILFRLARAGPDALGGVRLGGAMPAHRALLLAACMLLASALVDGLVALDFGWANGAHAGFIVAIANLVGLLVIALAAAVGRANQIAGEPVAAMEEAAETSPLPRPPRCRMRRTAGPSPAWRPWLPPRGCSATRT